jgi:hypothetical protein
VTFVALRTPDGLQSAFGPDDNAGNTFRPGPSMKRLHRLLPTAMSAVLLGALTITAAGAAEQVAGPTYRIIGPDGKVTFSDRKPTDPQLKTRELGQKVNAPLLAPAREPFDLHPLATLPPGSRSAYGAGDGLVPAADISGKPFPPGLPDAILDVVVHQFFVQTLVETCSRLRPAFMERYQGGVRNWRDRNADILARSNRITFTRFTGEQRDTLRATGRARLAPLLPAADATDADKMSWCDRMSTDLARHQMELVGDARISPIVDFPLH